MTDVDVSSHTNHNTKSKSYKNPTNSTDRAKEMHIETGWTLSMRFFNLFVKSSRGSYIRTQ